MLCGSHWATGSWAPYKLTHQNHSCSKWVRASLSNYRWLIKHALALCDEYTQRYGKIHKCLSVIEWCRDHEPNIPELGLTPFALAIKRNLWEQCFVENDPVETYRRYYKLDKARFAKWKRNKPEWWDIEK